MEFSPCFRWISKRVTKNEGNGDESHHVERDVKPEDPSPVRVLGYGSSAYQRPYRTADRLLKRDQAKPFPTLLKAHQISGDNVG